MERKGIYHTRQMKELMEYLKMVEGKHVTVVDIQNYFQEKGKQVGVTTIYRHLDRMVGEGTVAKYIVDEKTSACYEYLGEGEHCHPDACFHCKCEKCGKLIHLHCNELIHVHEHVWNSHGFQVNGKRTVLYGLCEDCQK